MSGYGCQVSVLSPCRSCSPSVPHSLCLVHLSLTKWFSLSSFYVIFSCPVCIMFSSTSRLVSQTSAVFPSSLPRFPFCVNIVSVFSCLLSISIILPAVCSVSLVFPSLIPKCLHGFVMSICESCNKAAFESCIFWTYPASPHTTFMTVSCVWTFMKSWEKPNIWTINIFPCLKIIHSNIYITYKYHELYLHYQREYKV